MMASSSSSSSRPGKHDVLLSFMGDDVCKSFVDNLYSALCQQGVRTFKDNELPERGKEISAEFQEAIERSRLALIVFSENYAYSSRCLDALLKIFECKELKRQMVLPVFYKLDPSNVRKQKETFAAAFDVHKKVYSDNAEKVQAWRGALKDAANISGWDTQNTAYGHELECIQEIVRGVLSRLVLPISCVGEDLVGIDSRVDEVCSLLETRLDDVQVVGIWGMGGIGKTTIAKAVHDRISHQFDDSCFLAVREVFEKHGREAVEQQFHSVASKFRNERVLVILDDVDQIAESKLLPEGHYWVGLGSRIIITARDLHLLISYEVHCIYEVKALDKNEAFQLFYSKAFEQSYPREDYLELSNEVVCYAAGLPLALKVLGSSLFGNNESEWKRTLRRLKKIPNSDIFQVLKISFDRLAKPDQQIFLDIACFFKGEELDFVKGILDGCEFDPHIGISHLVQKSLITVSENKIQMHALMQELGWHIVRQEDPEEPGRRSRLWILEDVCHVLTENTVTDTVEGICLDSHMPEHLNFSTEAFKKMNELRLLKVHSAHFSQGPDCLPTKLSWLNWYGYPSKSLPSSFKAKRLVELCMHHSNIIELWKERKVLHKLISIDLSHSQKLRSTPDFTGLLNLKKLILKDCTSLVEVHSSIAFHKRLVFINLNNCRNLKSLPNCVQLESLNILILSGCLKLEKFPEIVGNMESLSELYLDGTAIKELPSSIEHLTNLVLMNLKGCKNLKSLPDSICRLRRLKNLDISCCIKLDRLPQKFGDIEHLEELYVSETAIQQLPSSIVPLRNLKILSLSACKGKESKSLCPLFLSCLLRRESQDLMSAVLDAVLGLHRLKKLDISGCNLIDWQFPNDLGCLSSLEELNLSQNNFVNVPASINQLSRLRTLWLVGCNRLEALTELPTSIVELYADDCTSLGLSHLSAEYKALKRVSFSGCSKLLAYEQSDGLADFLLKHMLQLELTRLQMKGKKGFSVLDNKFSIILPGSDIPNWFTHQNMGHSISVKLPPLWYNDEFMGFAISIVSKSLSNSSSWLSGYLQKLPCIPVSFTLKSYDHRKFRFTNFLYRRGIEREVNSEHVCIGYITLDVLSLETRRISPRNLSQLEVSFPDDEKDSPFVKPHRVLVTRKVGVRLIYKEEVEKMYETTLNKYSSQPEDLRLLDASSDG